MNRDKIHKTCLENIGCPHMKTLILLMFLSNSYYDPFHDYYCTKSNIISNNNMVTEIRIMKRLSYYGNRNKKHEKTNHTIIMGQTLEVSELH